MSRIHYSKKAVYEAALALKAIIDAKPLSRASFRELLPDIEIGRNILVPAFKQITGHSNYRSYQRQRRMEAASKMLLSGMTIKEVTVDCGYGGYISNFARDFKLVFKKDLNEWMKDNTVSNVHMQTFISVRK